MKVQLLGYVDVKSKKHPEMNVWSLNCIVLEPQGIYRVDEGRPTANILVNKTLVNPTKEMLGHVLDLQSSFGSRYIDKVSDLGK